MERLYLESAIAYAAAALVGLAAIWFALPASTLSGAAGLFAAPVGDLPTNLIGHLAFQAPGWHWPLLNAPDLAWPKGQSIAMTDSNPLLSIVAKILATLRGQPANLFGLWLAACLVLQPVTAVYALRGLAPGCGANAILAAITAAILSLLLPELLFRVIHINLLGQFLLLAALGLAVRHCRAQRPVPFAMAFGFLALAMLVHPYLFIFCALTLAAPLLQLRLTGRPGAREGLRALGVAILLIAGLFILLSGGPGGGGPGFGLYSMDLLGPVWPQRSGLFGPDMPMLNATGFQHEGFNYLGAGVLVLLLMAAAAALTASGQETVRAHWRNYAGLAAFMAFMTALAVTPHVTAGGHVILPIGTDLIGRPLSIVRASGRAFWVVGYALMLGAIGFLANRLRPPVFAGAMAAALILQWADAAPLRQAAIAYLAGAGQTPPAVTIPPGTTLYRTVPVCDPDSVVADEYRLLALRQGAHLADARLAHDPNDSVCAALKSAGISTPLAPAETRLFLPSVQAAIHPSDLGVDVTCRASPAGLLCHRPLSILGSVRPGGAAGR
jgi:hypothetical protein